MKVYLKIIIFILIINNYLYSEINIYENRLWKDLKAILQNHPTIKSQILNLSSKIEEYKFKKSYYPDPRFGIMWSNVPYNKHLKFQFDKDPMSGIEYSISQPIPFPGKLSLEAKIQEIEVELERLKLGMEYNQTTKKILNLLLSYYTTEDIHLLLEDYYNKFKIIKESNKAKYTTGKGTLTDYSNAILLEKQLEEEMIQIQGNSSSQIENLNYYYSIINNQNYKEKTYKKEILNYIEFLYNLAKDKNEDLIIKESIIYNFYLILPELENKKIKLQKYEYFPDFEIFFSYMVRKKIPDNSMSGEDLMSAGISFRIPLWSTISNPNAVNSQEYNFQKTNVELKEIELNLKTKLRELKIEINTLKTRIHYYKNILIPQLELSYQSGLLNYTVGKIDYYNLWMILLDLIKFNKEYYQLQKEYYFKIIDYLELSNQILPEIPKITINNNLIIKEVNNEK